MGSVSNDIVDHLYGWNDHKVSTHWEGCYKVHPRCQMLLAADEIQCLRVALALACNELFGTCDPLQTSPHQLMAHFLEEARNG